jgi:hypothetical protein
MKQRSIFLLVFAGLVVVNAQFGTLAVSSDEAQIAVTAAKSARDQINKTYDSLKSNLTRFDPSGKYTQTDLEGVLGAIVDGTNRMVDEAIIYQRRLDYPRALNLATMASTQAKNLADLFNGKITLEFFKTNFTKNN